MAQRRVNGAAVKAIRLAVGIKQQDLAARVGLSGGHLSHVEKGTRTVSAFRLRRLANELGVELDAISISIPGTEDVAA